MEKGGVEASEPETRRTGITWVPAGSHPGAFWRELLKCPEERRPGGVATGPLAAAQQTGELIQCHRREVATLIQPAQGAQQGHPDRPMPITIQPSRLN